MPKSASYAQWYLESYCIGLKLRSLRTQKRLTLARLAAETGLSTALLSKLETDRMIPTLPTLATISRVYGVGMSHFFSEPTRHTLSITRKAHFKGYERGLEPLKLTPLNTIAKMKRPNVEAGHAEEAVSPAKEYAKRPNLSAANAHAKDELRLVAQMIEFSADGSASTADCLYESTGLMYVLEGQLQLDSGGLHETLEPGDCAYVDSDMALAWSAGGKERCRVLAVFPGPDARAEG